jgi:hypothetical protein
MADQVTLINVSNFEKQTFNTQDTKIIPNKEYSSQYDIINDSIEVYIYDLNKDLISFDYNYKGWASYFDPQIEKSNKLENIYVDPIKDTNNLGFNTGEIYIIYNFVSNRFLNNLLYIDTISGDRTEILLKTNNLSNEELELLTTSFKEELSNYPYFVEFYLNFGQNEQIIGINIQLDKSDVKNYSLLIKLYEPLPLNIITKDTTKIQIRIANPIGYNVSFDDTIIIPDNLNYIKGPNLNLNINNKINNSTEYQSYGTLIKTALTGSFSQIKSLLNEKGVEINIDYNNFSNFVHFSSAAQRVLNFYHKAGIIESYQNDITTLTVLNDSTQKSSSISILQSRIDDVIENFDGYDYFLYYESGSNSWPKSNATIPYTLFSTGSNQVLSWVGSFVEDNAWYGGQIMTASFYDDANQDNLINSIPSYIKDIYDERGERENEPYIKFVSMVGQHFDNLFLYTDNITEKSNADNRLEKGVSKDLIADVLKSLGLKIYENNFTTDDIYASLLGITTPNNPEYITNSITASNEIIPIDDLNKSIYKRLYHNLPYLLKKKGTLEGLKVLINTYGIPDTILRISEFGGKDKINSNDWDLFYNRYSYNFTNRQSSVVNIPWVPLYSNFVETQTLSIPDIIVPDTIEFRFKTTGIPPQSHYSQSLFTIKNPTDSGDNSQFNLGVFLFYTGSGYSSGSYSASIADPYNQYGNLRFYISGTAAQGGYAVTQDIYLPFFDKGWWSIMLKRDQHDNVNISSSNTVYSLYTKNKIYTGYEGDQLGFQGSSSLNINGSTSSSINTTWNTYNTQSGNGLWLGGFISGSSIGSNTLTSASILFTGSFQEFRYYSRPLNEEAFDDYVMNPESIEGNQISGSQTSYRNLSFRAPLGNELESNYSSSDYNSHIDEYTSYHPAITGSYVNITQSFMLSSSYIGVLYGTGSYGTSTYPFTYAQQTSSLYNIYYYEENFLGDYIEKQTEIYYLDQPVVGIKNRITDKIRIVSSSLYGDTLSSNSSLQQNYTYTQKYTKDINSLEVAFSPQNEINDDIIAQLGYFNIGEFIGDPRHRSETEYPDLNTLRKEYFKKYYDSFDYTDYIKLIKYFDNSLFKLIKDFTPARTSLTTGVVIKQHILERNKYKSPQMSFESIEYTASIKPQSRGYEEGTIEKITGGNGGVYDITQDNLYSGELSGSIIGISIGNQVLEPLLNNVSGSRTSFLYQTIDYNTNTNFPININSILSGSIYKAEVQDSNYISGSSYVNARYNGSKLIGAQINKYNVGDITYGKQPVINNNSIYLAHFQRTPGWTPEVMNSVKAEINFLIDENLDTIRIKGDNAKLNEIQRLFPAGQKAFFDYFDTKRFEADLNAFQQGIYTIHSSGYEYKGYLGTQSYFFDPSLNTLSSDGKTGYNENINIVEPKNIGQSYTAPFLEINSHSPNYITGSSLLYNIHLNNYVTSSQYSSSKSPEKFYFWDINSTAIKPPFVSSDIQTANGVGFSDFKIPIIFEKGDEIRFGSGSITLFSNSNLKTNNHVTNEDQTYIITNIELVTANSLIIFKVDRSIELNKIESGSFFFRKKVEQETTVLLIGDKPAGGTSDGFIYNEDILENTKNKIEYIKSKI